MLNVLEETKSQKSKLKITIKWMSEHQNITRNEKGDAETKRAAREKGKLSLNPKYAVMKSAWNMEIKNAIKQQWDKEWKEGKENAR